MLRFRTEALNKAQLPEYLSLSFFHPNLLSITGIEQTYRVQDIIKELLMNRTHAAAFVNAIEHLKGPYSLKDYMMSIGQDCQVKCLEFREERDCCGEAREYLGQYGTCFRFPSKTQYVGGIGYGHFFKLNTESYSRSGVHLFGDYPFDGVFVRLAHSETDLEYQARLIPAGLRTQIGLRKTVGTFLSTNEYRCKNYEKEDTSRAGCINSCFNVVSTFSYSRQKVRSL